MRSPNRDRPNYRSTALCAVSLLFAVLLLAAPAAANTADLNETASAVNNTAFLVSPTGNTAVFTLSENGTILSVEATLINQDSYLLMGVGLLGEDQPLEKVSDLTLTVEDGTVVEPKNSKGTLTFPEGNYTLTYSYPVTDKFVYAKFLEAYDVTVLLPKPYTTGHQILGTISGNGVISKSDEGTTVIFEDTKMFSVTFYEENREPILYLFLGGWLVVFLLVYSRYRKIKKNRLKI